MKLIQQLHDGTTKTYLARDRASKRSVLVHFLPKTDSPEREFLLRLLDKLPAGGRKLVIERGEQDGTVYVVTENLPGSKSMQDWLDRAGSLAGPASTERSPSQPAPRASVPAEFTPVLRVPSAEAAPPGAAPPASKSGEFTMLFQAPQAAPAPPPKSGPGEFTMFFSSPPLKESLPASGSDVFRAPLAEPPPRANRGAGDFTMFFGKQSITPEAAPAPSAPASGPYGITSDAPLGAAPDHHSSAPGEYSRVVATASPEPAPAEPIAPPAPQQQFQPQPLPAQQSSNLPLMLIFSFLFLVAFGLILYFALKH